VPTRRSSDLVRPRYRRRVLSYCTWAAIGQWGSIPVRITTTTIEIGGIMTFLTRFTLVVLALSTVTGCSTIYRTTGWFAYDFTEDYANPCTMKSSDPEHACGMTSALSPALMSFTELTFTPDRAAVTMNMMMGTCAEEKAHEQALAYIRALKAQNIHEAKD